MSYFQLLHRPLLAQAHPEQRPPPSPRPTRRRSTSGASTRTRRMTRQGGEAREQRQAEEQKISVEKIDTGDFVVGIGDKLK
ncbi:GD17414 [Drosophila simulans]|uniref:GD17414 n=1 Tax=Drosophila simulans TaxID=7240 RepID=B4R792_DROSI|nr:GD17414 [Drosophila simulans]